MTAGLAGGGPLLVLERLHKVYRTGWPARRTTFRLAADLALEGGQIIGVVGPNGAGKTTLFEMMTGSNRPSSGRVLVGGVDIHRVKYGERDRLAIHYHQSYQVRSFDRRVPSVLLQGSPTRRPVLHLFDEPQFNTGDGYIGFMVDFFFRLRAEGKLVFVCLHPTARYHLEILREIADRFLVIEGGRVVEHGSFAGLVGDGRVQAYLGAAMMEEAMGLVGGVRMSATLTPAVDVGALDGLFDVAGQRVFIPGGYGALGEAIAWGFARRGARVAIAGPTLAKAERLAGAIRDGGGDAMGVVLDARSVAGIGAAVAAAAAGLGGIDTLVNYVGVQREQALLEVTEEVFDAMYETNLRSAMFLAQAVARVQIGQGEAGGRRGGRHVHILSVRSSLALRGRGYSAYCATKGGMLMLVRQHAMELAPHGITVNGVAPTFIRSDRIRPHLERAAFREAILARNPLGRIGDPVEVVGPVLMLSAAAGGYVTGQVLYVDGGVTASQ